MDIAKIKVSEVMSRGVVTVGLEARLEEILNQLLENKVHAVIVTAKDGEFMGVVSHSDIIETLARRGQKIFELTAEDIMCPKPYYVKGDASLKEAAVKMINNGVHRLIVFSSHMGRLLPVGILSAIDIVRVVSQ
ncbi:CBS domain-containing protein [Thermosulfuriphilus ammonigenes]|uniref:CBS domain-containing protein n=1 Tax=Thermosulfuriphilus ammonigenes TaxID=1936021 RepID=A0A6G7PU14_9BACT|nr:CBS domain-containing protein [Thermosulfuriphilus ammonigenes]MBA2848963.1 putative transcriptional regulator [Thermosulfuriphilus ammonigenes]QIJ70923.1 CBS domain-containing protein [Thermosulfuriphilus ammonigenes]